MSFRFAIYALSAPMFALAACGGNDDGAAANEATLNNAAAAEQGAEAPANNLAAEDIELPPMVTRSPSYRCDDGGALYVDVLSDKSAVMVRDSRSDIPTRLDRETETGPFTGEERALSGTGAQVTYSAPDRPQQSCREAAA